MNKKIILILMMGLFFVSLACAQPPSFQQFYGDVVGVGDRVSIIAMIDGVDVGHGYSANIDEVQKYGYAESGLFFVDGRSGDKVNFYVDGRLAVSDYDFIEEETRFLELTYNADGESLCGNGDVDFEEECDGSVVDLTCADFGYDGGSLGCTACKIDESGCTITPKKKDVPSSSGSGITPPKTNFVIDLKEINLDMAIDSNTKRFVKVINNGTSVGTVVFRQSDLEGNVVFDETSFKLLPKQSKTFGIVFFAPNSSGIYTGKIFIGGKELLVSMNVRSKLLLFEALIAIPEYARRLFFGGMLDVQVTLVPVGDGGEVDADLNYVIKDYEGEIYLSESEEVFIDMQKDFKKEFSIKGLPVGDYVIGLELIYPGGVVTSSSQFKIIVGSYTLFNIILIVLVVGVLIGVILMVRHLIRRRKKRKGFKKR